MEIFRRRRFSDISGREHLTMSHHYSGPDFGFPLGDARLDLTDLYAFVKPGDARKSILIINVHPSTTLIDPVPTTAEPFALSGLYEFKIDTNGDAIADIAYRMRVSLTVDGTQIATLRRVEGQMAAGTGDDGQVIVDGAPVSTGHDAHITQAGDYRFFAGWRSDPFFFDTPGALNNLQFTGADFFMERDVCSIVVELPNSAMGSGPVGLWARILDNRNGDWVQVERGARPQQAVFLPGSESAAYLAGQPSDDARFVPVFAHALEHTGGYSPAEAVRVASALLPDILLFDPAQPTAFPNNGRTLTDDAADVFIAALTNGRVRGDNVGPHRDQLTEFPYVGPPHSAREVS
jgi:hypothetical protein